jgi:hypothetical protein
MAEENWQRIKKVLDDDLRQKPEERRNFVLRKCGADKTLLAEVESLLASMDSAEDFLEIPAVASFTKSKGGQFVFHLPLRPRSYR